VAAGLVAGLVVACGGGGGGNFAGIDRLGVTTGTINGFGSIIVNGVTYSTTGATFDIDDSGSGTQADLRVGQQVTIQWSSADDGVTRRAETVSYDDSVEGPIASIDLLTQSLVVLGQVVLVDGTTSFDDGISPRDLTGLVVGQFVEVSGPIDANGAVRATRIEGVNANDDGLEVRGLVESLDTLDKTFVINSLIVDYSQVINPPALSNGLFVEVEGEAFNVGTGTLTADKVEPEDDGISGADDGDEGEVEGYITTFSSATNFTVSGVAVTTNGQTTYEDGNFDPIAANNVNIKVEVEGEVNTSGVLVARRVEFKSGDSDGDGDDDSIDGRVFGNVTGTPGATTFSVAGVTVTVTAETRFEDQTGAVDQVFGLGDINAGDYVEVRGALGTGAALTAIIVERDDANPEGLLRGAASSIANPNLSVLGVPVITNGGTQFRDSADNAITSGDFFLAAANGAEVQVKFTQGGGTIVADEVELED
jgi:hypothetical protein